MAGRKWTKENDDFLILNAKNYSSRELGTMLNRSKGSILGRLKILNITDVKFNDSKIRYSYNKDYFKVIDTEEKAYWLGFIFADGCISEKDGNSKRLKITLKLSDLEHISKFINSIEGNLKPSIKTAKCKGKDFGVAEVVINCTEMCNDLIKLGAIPNKTKLLEVPEIEYDLKNHFMRGYIDGDGSLYMGDRKGREGKKRFAVEIVGYNCKILDDINEYFNENGISSKIYFKRENNSKVGVYGKDSINKLIELVYINSNIYLDRKYEKALLIKSTN